MALYAEDHHGRRVALRPTWRFGHFPQAGGAKPLGAHFVRLIRALRFDGAGAVGDCELPPQGACGKSRRARHLGRRTGVH